MNTKLLIGICGKPNAGKDTVADFLVTSFKLLKYGPSVPLKETASKMFDIPLAWFSDRDKKEQVIPFWNMSPRKMAQLVGKECSRDILGGDFWMKHVTIMWDKIKNNHSNGAHYEGMVLPDIRYIEDAQWVIANHGTLIEVTRPEREQIAEEQHAAENQVIPDNWISHEIVNRVPMDELKKYTVELGTYLIHNTY